MNIILFAVRRRPRITIEGGIEKSTQWPIWLLHYTDEDGHLAYVGDAGVFYKAHAMAKEWERDGARLVVLPIGSEP